MSKFEDSLIEYAKELGVEEAVIYPQQQPTAAGQQPGQSFDLYKTVFEHPDMKPLIQQHQILQTKMAQTSAAIAQTILKQAQTQLQAHPQAGNPAGGGQVAPAPTAVQ